jgi:pyruvate dehydrogenase E2 component (dihydrolipoamide acetyltransferase)
MATKVFMEALSPTMEEGRVVTWHKREGDTVAVGDILAEVETDKAIMELQARGAGVLRKIVVAEGSTVDVGSLVAVIAGPDEDISDIGGKADGGAPEKAEPAARPAASETKPDSVAPTSRTEPTPATGPARPAASAAGAGAAPAVTAQDRIKASPLARKLASDRGLDLAGITGTGPGGRIIKRDLEGVTPAAATVAPAAGGYEDVALSQVRKTIARRLVTSLGPIPHFFLTTEVDMNRAAEAREELNARSDQRISFNDIIIKVVAAALREHRSCNAWWQDDHIRYFDDVHVGMAVAIEDGLITPVIRHAHAKTLRQIASESRVLAERARERKLKPDEYTGATFSVSNLGMFGIDQFTAVINPPEAGILAVGAITDRPVVLDGAVAVRKRLRLTMSCDHRVIDGATGARFLETVRHMLENPLAIVW